MSESELFSNTFIAKKHLGQNFMVDRKVIARIMDVCGFSPDEIVLEVGPGRGALTREILPRVRKLVAVEADRELADRLRGEFSSDLDKLELYHADFLKFDLSFLSGPVKVVGNVPYYISSPIISHVIEQRSFFSQLFITSQLEFGERLIARPRSKDFGALSVLVQYFTEPKLLFRIGNRSFRPVPKVNSCFIRIDLRKSMALQARDEKFFTQIVRQSFSQRRKKLVNALAGICPKKELADLLERYGAHVRAEDLSVEDFVRLADDLLMLRR